MIMNDEQVRIWKDSVVVHLKLLSRHSSGDWGRTTTCLTQDNAAEIQIGYS